MPGQCPPHRQRQIRHLPLRQPEQLLAEPCLHAEAVEQLYQRQRAIRRQRAGAQPQRSFRRRQHGLRIEQQPAGRVRQDTHWPGEADQIARPALERRRHAGSGAKPAGHHQRRSHRVAQLLGFGQKIRLAPSRPGFPGAQAVGIHHPRLFIIAAGNLQKIDAFRLQHLRDRGRLVRCKAAALEIRTVQLDRNAKTRARCRLGRANGQDEKPRAIFQAAAPAIGAAVGQRRQKSRQQIAVRRVQLHAGKPCVAAGNGGSSEPFDKRQDFVVVERLGHSELLARQPDHNRACSLRAAIDADRRLPPGMRQLRENGAAAAACSSGQGFQAGCTCRVQRTGDRDVSRPFEMLAIDLDVAGDAQPEATIGPPAIQRGVRSGCAIAAVGKPFGHRRFGDAVRQDDPGSKGERCCKGSHPRRIDGEASGCEGTDMRGFAPMPAWQALLAMLVLAGCSETPAKLPEASEKASIDRSVADVAAAEAAASTPLPVAGEAPVESR